LQAIHAGGVVLELDAAVARGDPRQRRGREEACAGQRRGLRRQHGFGKLASQRIEAGALATLQTNLIRSHSVGVGAALPPAVVRLVLALKAASLARGYSGVRETVVDTLITACNAGLVPYVPSQGSVGASGDLAPLAHLTLALTGEGEMLAEDGTRVPAAPALASAGIAPLVLEAKEGPGADQRHPGLDRAGAARAARVRAGARGGARRRRADGRRRARQRRPVRPADPRPARPAGPDRRRPVLPGAARRQRDPPLAPRRRRPGAGPV
jgi:histidine ammonia-lyase